MTYFDEILERSGGNERSVRWFRDQIRELGTPPPKRLISEGKVRAAPLFGKMNFFGYDPKHKATLPYYDRFPLIMPIEVAEGGFIGLNFHYLSIPMRVKLLNVISEYATDNNMNDKTKIRLTWNRVKRNPLVKPTVKRYLFDHVKSPFRVIDADEMMTAVLLPVQKFVGATTGKVYSDSRRMNR